MSYLGSQINTDDYSDLNDVKISELTYDNPITASYAIGRKSVAYHPISGNQYIYIYSVASGGTTVQFKIERPSDWLVPSSVRIMFTLRKSGTFRPGSINEQLVLVGGAHAFFCRLSVLSHGLVLNDISDYNRVHEMFSYMKSQKVKSNELSDSCFYLTIMAHLFRLI